MNCCPNEIDGKKWKKNIREKRQPTQITIIYYVDCNVLNNENSIEALTYCRWMGFFLSLSPELNVRFVVVNRSCCCCCVYYSSTCSARKDHFRFASIDDDTIFIIFLLIFTNLYTTPPLFCPNGMNHARAPALDSSKTNKTKILFHRKTANRDRVICVCLVDLTRTTVPHNWMWTT